MDGPWQYKPYPAYRDSGVEWMGQIPRHWEKKRLKFLAPLHATKLNAETKGITYVGLENIESWTGRLLAENQLESTQSSITQFQAGDVLFGKLRPYLAKAVCPDFNGVSTSELLVLRPNGCLPHYLLYLFLNEQYVRWIDKLTYGTRMPRVGPEQVGGSFAPLPPLGEQRAIAGFLDRETEKIDALVAKKERLIELLKKKRTALIAQAVTKGLHPDVSMKESDIEWLGKIPAHWQVKKVTHLFSVGSGTTPPTNYPDYYDGEVPWVTTSELRESVITFTEKRVTNEALRTFSALNLYPEGSVAVAMYGATIGRVGVFGTSAAVNQACCVFFGSRGMDAWFWFYWLQSRRPYLISLGYGGGQPNLSQELLKSIRVPTPTPSEQREIVALLNRETNEIDGVVAKVREAIERLKELRTALISAAVTGRIDVREAVA